MMHVRWMIRRDMDEVLEIENLCFEHPWSEQDFIRALRCRNTIGMVHENGPVKGFMVYELYNNRLEIVNFAVKPCYQRQGVGMAMVEELKGKCSRQCRQIIVLDIRETNLDGQLFFKAMGFEAVQVLREYESTGEDAYRFMYRVPQEAFASVGKTPASR